MPLVSATKSNKGAVNGVKDESVRSASALLFPVVGFCDNNTPDAAAQYALGSDYDDGGTRDIDYGKARYWYEKSSARGNLDAMRALGFMYEKCKGIEVNYTKAIEI